MTRHHAKHVELRRDDQHQPTRWWERVWVTWRDCPACQGDGEPDGCVHCGQVAQSVYRADDAYADYRASEEAAELAARGEATW